ncbi:flippase [Siminovitchia terrae]|uniref:oligosaccharide flippase family protein n=1 Tax=Siminovitchia terrae TaxID=1914933 RepID=UPI001B1E990F|nr:oligosaccharide flippase family protein [Siminovitchia terrae]GIN90666.1 flippase [Siminovitchia terrae]
MLKLKQLISKGFFHIFGANVINKIIGFASSIFLVRILTKEQFGLLSYSQNLLMFFLLFNGLGTISGMLQFGSESENKSIRSSYFRFGLKIGITFNLFVSICIVFFGAFLPVQFEKARIILIAMLALPICMFTFESIQTYFRTSLENKKFSFLTTINTLAVFLFSITGALLFQAVGVIIFQYIAYMVTIIIGLFFLKDNLLNIKKANKLAKEKKRAFMKFSIVQSFNNGIAQMLYVIDIFIIGIIISNELVIASYKTATLIPFALNFIPMSIMVFIYPYFAKKNKDKLWIRNNFIKLIKYLMGINIMISLFLIIFSKLIVTIAFGSDYQDSVLPFIILSIGYFFAGTFRIPVGNVLVMLKEVKFGLYLSILTGVLNIVLNIVLITYFGSLGAAISTVLVFIFTSGIGMWYLFRILKVPNKI